MRENLNEKLDRHKWSILKLVEDSLIDGEILISYKQKDGNPLLYIISEERLEGVNGGTSHKILNLIINKEGESKLFTVKTDK